MKSIFAFLAIAGGAILASFGVAQTDPSVEGWVSTYQVHTGMAVGGLVLLAVGIVLLRSGSRDARTAQAAGSLAKATAALTQVVERTEALAARLDQVADVAELHRAVDAIVAGPAVTFGDNRQAISDAHGLTAYAAVMGPFAQGERYLNRAWSAATDRHLQEAVTYVRRAAAPLAEARQALQQIAR